MRNVNQIYATFQVENESDHLKAMWESLTIAASEGLCEYKTTENGCGEMHKFSFKKEEQPMFACISNDVFNQIRIETLD